MHLAFCFVIPLTDSPVLLAGLQCLMVVQTEIAYVLYMLERHKKRSMCLSVGSVRVQKSCGRSEQSHGSGTSSCGGFVGLSSIESME